ncbi:hypothetical protein HDV00_007591 [Rhizophlyctis rosea]|nr:hypothetical protein HDV00_007591 [Rhizophlyctis rosea]
MVIPTVPLFLLLLLTQTPHAQPTSTPLNLTTTCTPYPQYILYNQPHGCHLCNKLPIPSVPAEFINPITFSTYTSTPPPFQNYSTWAQENVSLVFRAEVQAGNYTYNDRLIDDTTSYNLWPDALKERWESNWDKEAGSIPCACIGVVTYPTGCSSNGEAPFALVLSYDCRRTEGYGGAILPELHCYDFDEGTFTGLNVDQRDGGEAGVFLGDAVGGRPSVTTASAVTSVLVGTSSTVGASGLPAATNGAAASNVGVVPTGSVETGSPGGASSSGAATSTGNVPTNVPGSSSNGGGGSPSSDGGSAGSGSGSTGSGSNTGGADGSSGNITSSTGAGGQSVGTIGGSAGGSGSGGGSANDSKGTTNGAIGMRAAVWGVVVALGSGVMMV